MRLSFLSFEYSANDRKGKTTMNFRMGIFHSIGFVSLTMLVSYSILPNSLLTLSHSANAQFFPGQRGQTDLVVNDTQGPAGPQTLTVNKNASGGPLITVPGATSITFLSGASVEGNPNLSPKDAQVPLGNKVVWVNKDTVPHTSTSGTGASDSNSGKIFDTKIIINGQTSPPEQLIGAKVGDVIPYYCQIHPFITGKITVTTAR